MTTETTAQPKPPSPPYLPWKTLDNTVNGWKAVVPQRVDRSLLSTYAGTMQGLLLSSLKYLRLIDAQGQPTDVLRHLVAAEGEQRKKILGGIVRQSYPFLFQDGFDLTKATPQQLREKFETTGINGETLDKAISFFTALAKAADIHLSPFVKVRERSRGSRKAAKKAARVTTTREPEATPPAQGQAMRTVTLTATGGTLTLSGTFNPFTLAGDERTLVNGIIDLMNGFEQKQGGKK